MPATSTQKIGLEGYLYYNLNPDADENTVDGWSELAYITGFSTSDNKNKLVFYNKYTKEGTKRGIREITGNITQIYTKNPGSVQKLFEDDVPVALKLEVMDDGVTLSETIYLTRVDFDSDSFDAGNLNGGTDPMTDAFTFTAATKHTVAAV